MGIFNFFKKKDDTIDQDSIKDLIAFSKLALRQAIPEIEKTKSFSPFGGVLTTEEVFEKIIYLDPNNINVDPREIATKVQKVIENKYKDPKTKLLFLAFDGIAHLSTGDIDSINVRVSNKLKRIDKILTYPYKIIENKVEFIDEDKPIIKSL